MQDSTVTTTIVPVACSGGATIAAFVYQTECLDDKPDDKPAVPILMLHGNGGSHGSFWQAAPLFAQERLVVAPDSRGQGISTRGEGRLTYELMAEDAVCVLDALGIEKAVVLGYSDGGIEALLLARDHPERIAGIVTLGANITPEGVEFDPAEEPLEDQATLLMSVADVFPKAAEGAELLRLMVDEPHIEAASLSTISCPASIMAGEFDVIVPEETAVIAESIPGAIQITVPGAGHSLLKDDFDAVVAEVRRVIEAAS